MIPFYALAFLVKSLNQIVVSIVVVGFMRGEEDKKKGDANAREIAPLIFSELHALYPRTSIEHKNSD